MRIHPQLPIYRLAGPGESVLLYTPGTLATVNQIQAEQLQAAWNGDMRLQQEPSLQEPISWLAGHARRAAAAREQWREAPYRPECLTVYLGNRCNLGCGYCFAAPARHKTAADWSGRRLDPAIFAAAAHLVGRHCAEKNRPFQLGCHGGGEPTVHWDLLLLLVRISREIAAQHAVPWQGYIATNGVLPADRARHLATLFCRVGLSCDGPPDIQDRQRPTADGGPTSVQVRRTAALVKQAGARLEIRATITPATANRQAEILRYLVTELGADAVTFEPVYGRSPATGSNRQPAPDPGLWAEHFLHARQEALRHRIVLHFAGFRPDEQHGPHCNVLRQSLHLTPDGKATNCFLVIDGDDSRHAAQIVGGFDPRSGRFLLDQAQIDRLRAQAMTIGAACEPCFAAWHCTRSCPETCPAEDAVSPPTEESAAAFRCQLHRAIGHGLLKEAALEMLRQEAHSLPASFPASAAASPLDETLAATMAETTRSLAPITGQKALRAWEASRRHYRLEDRGLPAPLWQTEGFRYDGDETWRRLRLLVNQSPARPLSLYLHIPFCAGRCGFCDCYTLPIKTGHRLHADYVDRLLLDLRQWSEQTALAACPVTTVHFGGGSPNVLAPELFSSLVAALRSRFGIRQSTEWAVEATARLLSRPHLERLRNLGFSRLHLGVQTLEEPLRRDIGRSEPATIVLQRLEDCLALGFITTVDLLYGLPGQTAAGFFAGIARLVDLGVHGLSLYRFNRSLRNRGFVRRYRDQADQADMARDYSLFLAADLELERAGYRKNHFCHYARPEDRNLYYTHARRGEDLLALGATADGVFADLHYRCPPLTRTFLDPTRPHPLFQGSVAAPGTDRHRAAVAAHLMTGSVPGHLLRAAGLAEKATHWRQCGLLRARNDEPDLFSLTGSGSWHLCAMLEELKTSDPS
ncbi:MAG: radical SAM protein [Desulfobulbus sp.]|jgi:coproporphyrinogen III oxidase-like Fe-S oxidoreductase/sulfatase maturation enzyme AslB (radical SAM superfamily)|uniref:radical SAM protein n=1 Tax=Desulfobulbus sp. TaxID=895 RepID=UPI002843FD16|nr:radical SAM protein [Desulfobulbus sp.]MDR2549544.1 radical SAM protein [Desulfobulbus sp.]